MGNVPAKLGLELGPATSRRPQTEPGPPRPAHLVGQVVCDPDVLGGKATVAGTRISVELLLENLAGGWSTAQVLDEYGLEEADLQAAFRFAARALWGYREYPTPKQTATATSEQVRPEPAA